jgi:DNA modification methylase
VTSWRIIEGDCREVLATLPDESIQCCVTSPPYFGLRDYGVDGQIGLEESPEAWLDEMVAVFREVRRVLRDDGTLWLNLGDAYNTRQRGSDNGWDKSRLTNPARVQKAQAAALRPRRAYTGSKPKDLLGLPWMVAFALRADGWWLREDVIWHKLTPMPESVTDRCTRSHEYVFRLTKSAHYFADQDAIREADRGAPAGNGFAGRQGGSERVGPQDGGEGTAEPWTPGTGRNKRSVWTLASAPFPDAHFATFPPKLVEPMILAATSPQACGECGAPWRRVVERLKPTTAHLKTERGHNGYPSAHGTAPQSLHTNGHHGDAATPELRTVGWEPTCDHGDGTGYSTVLDPFAGAGTTGLVAARLQRSFVGVELNPEYVELARRRIRDDAPLLNGASEAAA